MNLEIIFRYLNQLKENNNRDWFHENKALYLEAKNEFELFVEQMIPVVNELDSYVNCNSPKECIFRIFRDIRFSKDKTPYKTHFGAYFATGGKKSSIPGYYIQLEPGTSFVGGGVHMPEPKTLKLIREAIYEKPEEFKSIIEEKSFKQIFPVIYGEKLKLAPKGFPKDFDYINLLKHKSYAVIANKNDDFWTQNDVISKLKKVFEIQKPFNTFLNRAVEI